MPMEISAVFFRLLPGLLLGFLYANAGEWLVHKYILHGLGEKRDSFWAYHCYEHHAACTKHGLFDEGYQTINLSGWNAQSKEIAVLAAIVLAHAPLVWFFPVFTASVYLSLGVYYYKHRKAHLNPEWARLHLPWHYQHHMDAKQAGNWCISWPWFDHVLGTRLK